MKKIIAFALAAMLLVFAFPSPFTVAYSAKAMAVYEPSNAVFLETAEGDTRLPMASTTKIMTALVVLENAELDREIKIPSIAVGVEGSSMYLVKDEPLTVEELLYGLMLTSGNDAATALAFFVGNGSIDSFVQMMNAKARKLGLTNTNFTNPSGLPDDEHYTTAKELAILTAAALENPVFARTVSTRSVKIRRNGVKDARTLTNHNKLLTMLEDAVGVKTGFTKKAGRCLVSAATRDGVTLICVTLNAPDDWNDHIQALNKGFKRTELTCLANPGDVKLLLQTPDGKTVSAKNSDKMECVVIDGKIPEKELFADKFVYAPKASGDIVGEVRFVLADKTVASAYLYLTQAIEAPVKKELFLSGIIRFIRNIF